MTQSKKSINRHTNIKFYRNKRIFRTFLALVISILIDEPWLIFLIYPISSVFWDWWFFSFWKKKESNNFPKELMDRKQVTAYEIDNYVNYIVKTKRITLLFAMVIGAIEFIINLNCVPIISLSFYSFVTCLIIVFQVFRKKIKYPYPLKISKDYIQSSDYLSDLSNISNHRGFFTPGSPLYIYKE